MKKTAFVFLFWLSALTGFSQFKVVGYVPTWLWDNNYYNNQFDWQLDLNVLTHVNIAFANPENDNGDLSVSRRMANIVTKSHEKGVKVLISLGGANAPGPYELLMKSSNRSGFISKIKKYLVDHDLDGVDIDLEANLVNADYSPFVLELADSLNGTGYLLTAALATTNMNNITQSALLSFDWINIMSYDYRGTWTANNPGQHSSVYQANADINTLKFDGLGADKIVLGVPFYGYDFVNNTTVDYVSYSSLVRTYPGAENKDRVNDAYYNGIPTIKEKTNLATKNAGGIMIWELTQDTFDDKSLLKSISTIADVQMTNAYLTAIYPNPVLNALHIELQSVIYSLVVTDAMGNNIKELENIDGVSYTLDVIDFPSGLYFLNVDTENGQVVRRFIKL